MADGLQTVGVNCWPPASFWRHGHCRN